jgi:hypothetical protein
MDGTLLLLRVVHVVAQAPPDRREALGAELARLRGRMRLAGRVVAVLLGIAIVTMAVGRYV